MLYFSRHLINKYFWGLRIFQIYSITPASNNNKTHFKETFNANLNEVFVNSEKDTEIILELVNRLDVYFGRSRYHKTQQHLQIFDITPGKHRDTVARIIFAKSTKSKRAI